MAEVGKTFLARFFQGGLILPNLVSMVVTAYLVFAFLNSETGFMNRSILPALGLPGIAWYSAPAYWPLILTVVHLWKSAGYGSIAYLAGITGIDPALYEAARVDGAGKGRQLCSITLPLLRPMISVMVLMSIGRIFSSDFGLFYQVPMNSGALYPVTQTIDTYVYRGLMRLGDVGMSSAAGLFQSVVGFALVLCANGLVRRHNRENALF
jgi:putative aldouronate transport system permease protein